MSDIPTIIEGEFHVVGEASPIRPQNLAQLRKDFLSTPIVREQAIKQWGEICEQIAQLHKPGSLPNPSLTNDLTNLGVNLGWLTPSEEQVYSQPGYERYNRPTHSEAHIVRNFATSFSQALLVNPEAIPVPKPDSTAPIVINTLKALHDEAHSLQFFVLGDAQSFAIDQPPFESWHNVRTLSKMVRDLKAKLSNPKTQHWISTIQKPS